METGDGVMQRLERLERSVRLAKTVALLMVAFASLFFVQRSLLAPSSSGNVLRVRGIVIEDSKGIPRLLLGAPAPNEGRKRNDGVTGLVLLSEDGTDRLTVGTADYDQVNGALQHRIASGIGLLLNDAKGNERGGFGFLDNGRVTLGLDRAHGEEGAFLTVNDQDGFAGVVVKDIGTCVVASFGNSKENGTELLLRDSNCADRVLLGLKQSGPKLEVRDSQERLVLDAFEKTH